MKTMIIAEVIRNYSSREKILEEIMSKEETIKCNFFENISESWDKNMPLHSLMLKICGHQWLHVSIDTVSEDLKKIEKCCPNFAGLTKALLNASISSTKSAH